MEQMMIQSVVNIQLENLKKEFKEFPFFMKNLLQNNPKELQCLGFNVADIDVTFKKSQMQMSAYYKETKYQNKELCDKFLQELRESPSKFVDQFNAQKNNPLMKAMEESQKLAAGGKGDLDPLQMLRDGIQAGMDAAPAHEEL